jgi:hypothetical protein
MRHRRVEGPGPTSGNRASGRPGPTAVPGPFPQTNGVTRGILPDSLSESDPESIPQLPPLDGLGKPITP